MKRSACIVAAGVWGGKRSLLKNRDRKYTPKIVIVHEIIDGTEVAYMHDLVTDWCEGLNEHGIGIANAALAVGLDEAEGTDDRHETNNKSDDGKRMLKALACKTLDEAIEAICEYNGGLEGHTFLSDPKRAVSVELVGKDCVVKDLDPDDIHVRTNHGRDTGGTGYTDGEGYLASAARKEKAIQILRQSKKPQDLGPDLMANRSEKEPHTINDPVRDAKKMKTTSQMVMNLTDRELDFFVITGKMEYKGVENKLPKDYKARIKVKVFGYQDDGAKLAELDPDTGDPKGKARKVSAEDPRSLLFKPDITTEEVQVILRWLRDMGHERDHIGIDYDRFADWLNTSFGYETPRSAFTPQQYRTYYDWFLRRLAPPSVVAARANAASADVCSPIQGQVVYSGLVGDGQIELKDGPANILEALQHRDPDLASHEFVKFDLEIHDYHHIHSPVDGKVSYIHYFGENTDPFGHNNALVIELDTAFGRVFMCCIGELTVQSIHHEVHPGDIVRKVDRLGWFWWGSMMLVVFPSGLRIEVMPGQPVFVGDHIAMLEPRRVQAGSHEKSIALMKFLSGVAKHENAARHIYVTGGAVRDFLLGMPIKDIDVVVDSVSLGGRDSEWFAKKVIEAIPAPANLTTNQYGVAIVTVKGEWVLDGINMQGEVIEIANARKESYEGVGGKGKGYKPTDVVPATIEEDMFRREFTFNALLWRLLDLTEGPEKAEVIDITGLGRQHLQEKLISTPMNPDKTFSDDPTRQLRIIKFLLRYDLKIAPEVVASVKRNAHKLKNMPWEAVGNILVDNILASPKASQGLKVMKSLGILDVLVEMIRENKSFEAFLTRQLASGNHPVGLLLELADLGIAGRSLGFLTPRQRMQFSDVTVGMDDAEARRYLDALRKPPVDSLALIQEFNLQGSERGVMTPMARDLILEDPDLATNGVKLNDILRERLRPMTRTADLVPPLGIRGGPCKVVERIMDKIPRPGQRDRMISNAEVGALSNADARKVYPVLTEHGSGFKTFVIRPHAQYRMDYRSIPVRAVASALDSYLRWLMDLRANSPAEYQDLREQNERATWIDPKSKLKIVMDFSQGEVEIITAYWKGREDPPPMSCEAPMINSTQRVATLYLQAMDPLAVILRDAENLEALVADIQVILDTFENTVPMPYVGRIAAITLMSQRECFNKCEHALHHCERVINMARGYLQSHPGDEQVSSVLRDAQAMYEKFESFRARSREMLSAMSQKIMPTELKNTMTVVLNGVRGALKYPNSATITVAPRFAPCKVQGRPVDGLVFDAYLTVYPLPKDEHPGHQQFMFTQATMGDDLNLYMVAIDRQTSAPTKPVIVGADTGAVVKKVLGMLDDWTNLKG